MSDKTECFLCNVELKEGDSVCEFFGGFAHWDCFNKQMEENAERNKNEPRN